MKVSGRLLPLVFILIAACSKKEAGNSEGENLVDPILEETLVRGQLVYKQYCIACHMEDGSGAPPMNPPLIKTSFVTGDKKALIPVILNGMSGQVVDGEKYHNVMPPLDFLSNEQIADVLTYVRNSFGNTQSEVAPEEVKSERK